jgi:hypothetical protein
MAPYPASVFLRPECVCVSTVNQTRRKRTMSTSLTLQDFRRQYLRNAVQLRGLQAQAENAGTRVRGCTAAGWALKAESFERIAQLDDTSLVAHLNGLLTPKL